MKVTLTVDVNATGKVSSAGRQVFKGESILEDGSKAYLTLYGAVAEGTKPQEKAKSSKAEAPKVDPAAMAQLLALAKQLGIK